MPNILPRDITNTAPVDPMLESTPTPSAEPPVVPKENSFSMKDYDFAFKNEVTRGNIILASLDHALWFHRAFRIDEWLLYSMESTNASGARGYACGKFFKQDGTLVASTTQEGLIRVLDPSKVRRRSDPSKQV